MRHSLTAGLVGLFAMIFFNAFQSESIAIPNGTANEFGEILKKDGNIKNAISEHVVIYSQEHGNSTKKITRNGIVVRYPNAKATLLICHGFMCDKYDTGFFRYLFPHGSFNFMTFDFRGHGDNVFGQCCTFGKDEAYDVIAAAHFIRNHPQLKETPLIAYGFSMGAVAAIEAQAKDSTLFDAMVLDCPFDSSENVIKKGLDNFKFSIFGYEFDLPGRTLIERYAFHPYVQTILKVVLKTVAHIDPKNIPTCIFPLSPSESIKKVTIPCFFIHCKNDEKIPINSIKTIFKSAPGYKKLWITNGRRHFDSFFYNPEKYTDYINEFVDQVLSHSFEMWQRAQIIEDPDEEPMKVVKHIREKI